MSNSQQKNCGLFQHPHPRLLNSQSIPASLRLNEVYIYLLHTFSHKTFSVHCDASSGITTVGKNYRVVASDCSGMNCFEAEVEYPAPLETIVSLMNSLGNCSQKLSVECEGAPLEVVFHLRNHFSIHP